MAKLIQSLLFISLTLIYSIIAQSESELPYNPLDALKWTEINLLEQIQDEFKFTDPNTGNGIGGTSVPPNTAPNGIEVGFEVRTMDGLRNNNGLGAANSQAQRCMAPVYEDGIGEPNGQCRMNPREISNVLSKQVPEASNEFLNDRFLTQFAWQWGQFIDHDVTLISEDPDALDLSADIDIYVPCNDPVFDTEATCDADNFIQVFRTHAFPLTGDSATNPRQQLNEITSFIDASMIYGSDDERANNLRSHVDGKLAVTDDNFLPRNPSGLHNEPNNEEMFVLGGDVRTNEVSSLLTMHTIWVRFHNIIADEVGESIVASGISQIDFDNYDEIVYQYTKLIVTAIVQKITYTDWLPTMFGPSAIADFLGDYNGFDSTVNPSACLIFSSAAFRFGHTLLPNFFPLREQDCSTWELITECPECDEDMGGINMRNAFFVPHITEDYDRVGFTTFMDAILNGFSCTLANEVDVSVTEAVRNFLFESSVNSAGERTHGNLDLMAINLQRGREHGLPDYNSVREHVGLLRLNNIDELAINDPELQENIRVMYDDDIDDIDLFLGLLAEDHLEDGSFGATLSGVVLQQFARFRDGDRFWYQRYIQPGELLDFINCISLKQVIELTTGITNIDALDSIRHNLFQNRRAISVFAGTETFQAQAIPQTNIETNIIQQQKPVHHQFKPKPKPQEENKWNNNNNQEPTNEHPYIIQLTNMQILIIFAVIIVTIGCTCYTLHQCKKNKMNRYRPVKYDTETDTEASDREKLQV